MFYTVTDIASDLSISEGEAVALVRKLHKELRAFGGLVISGKVPAAWYGMRKADGFAGAEQPERVPLTERRLLSIKDFRKYAGAFVMGWQGNWPRKLGQQSILGTGFLWTVFCLMNGARNRISRGNSRRGGGAVAFRVAHFRTESKKIGI